MRIFILEDEVWYGSMLQHFLEKNPDYEVRRFESATDLFAALYLQPDIVTIDFSLPEITGDEVLKRVKSELPDTTVIIISGQEDVRTAVSLLKQGALEYIVKDNETPDRLWKCIQHISQVRALKSEVEKLKTEVGRKYDISKMFVGNSPAIKNIFSLIEKAAQTNITVTISGETGTGKEMAARAVHYNSARGKAPFVTINVAAIPRELIESELFGYEKGAFTGAVTRRIGKFEEAHKGTLFLDEIGELDISLQSKLLRVLQEREISRIGGNQVIPVDVRIIVATHKNLLEEVQAKRFREDLYYRLLGLPVNMPPLRDRDKDVLTLTKHFIGQFCKENHIPVKSLTPDAQQKLSEYPFPGNVRELKSVIELAVVLADTNEVDAMHINLQAPSAIQSMVFNEYTMKQYEIKIVQHFLDKYNFDVLKVAEKLDIGKSTIYRMAQAGEISLKR